MYETFMFSMLVDVVIGMLPSITSYEVLNFVASTITMSVAVAYIYHLFADRYTVVLSGGHKLRTSKLVISIMFNGRWNKRGSTYYV